MSANLLVELFTEELPPQALKRLGEAFAGGIVEGLRAGGLLDATSRSRAFASPRRLAVYVQAVLPKASSRTVEHKLMPAAVARQEGGGWSDALRRKLAGMQREKLADAPANTRVGTDMLFVKPDGKAESVYLRTVAEGRTLEQALSKAIEDAIAALPIPKVMSYQLADGTTTVKFVRPAHGLVALHGERVLAVSVLGLEAGRVVHGHRFQGAADIPLERADQYEARLEQEGRVIADFDKRRAEVARQLAEKALALKCSLGEEADHALLLDEVTALVERPTVYIGEFDAAFLAVPQECLILTMRRNQKYFPLFDAGGRLTNNFLIVSNMELANSKNIVEGNQRVVRPRLADARFFFETDKKTKLSERVPRLASVVYHNRLGTQLDRVQRVRGLAKLVAQKTGADAAAADRAALLAKADLLTSMVGEFPELQGTMGRYYALADGEDARVADAIEQHYRPRFAGDTLPDAGVATTLALADKLETLAGLFGIGQQPTGDKDPFALRRHALGVIRMLVEGGLAVPVDELVAGAFSVFPPGMVADAQAGLETFIFERLRGYLRDKGFSANEVEAVLCLRPLQLSQIPRQLEAVRAFASLPEAESLAAANKRVANILKQAEAKGESFGEARAEGLKEAAERDLFSALGKASADAAPLLQKGDFAGYLRTFAVLRAPVDAFFDSVMVMAEDAQLRSNRLALLKGLRDEMNRIADISKLAA
ncbi:MAG TPA: glycine--tRNA ligase subunit beta [Burkholderiales bacterium]|nr:glycine--tRNA ligase subunit beta [Burkholderiales bacterium]